MNVGVSNNLSFQNNNEDEDASDIAPKKRKIRNLSMNLNAGGIGSIWRKSAVSNLKDYNINPDNNSSAVESLKSKLLSNKRQRLKMNHGTVVRKSLNNTQ